MIGDWSDESIALELEDTEASIDFWQRVRRERAAALRDQTERSRRVYGERPYWPASSVHAWRQENEAVAEAEDRLQAALSYRADLRAVQRARRARSR